MKNSLQILNQALDYLKSETIRIQQSITQTEEYIKDEKKLIEDYLKQAEEIEIAIKLLEKKNGRKN